MGFFEDLFGIGKNKPQAPEFKVQPLQSLGETRIGGELEDIISSGLSGAGRGYDPNFVSRTTSPVVAEREARFREQELPALKSYYSARGFGRSTKAASDIGRATAAKERDINQVLAEAYLRDQIQRKSDEARQQALALQFAQGDVAAKQGAAGTETQRLFGTASLEEQARQRETQGINALLGTIGSTVSPFLGGGGGSQILKILNYLKNT